MPRYEVRLLMEIGADNPFAAVDGFIGAINQDGFRVYMYRVQDLDADPLGDDPIFVQGSEIMNLTQAADKFGVDLGEDEPDDPDDINFDSLGPIEVVDSTDSSDDGSVVSNVTE